jgi:hypothetical protein
MHIQETKQRKPEIACVCTGLTMAPTVLTEEVGGHTSVYACFVLNKVMFTAITKIHGINKPPHKQQI